MAIVFDGDNLLITLDDPVGGVLNQTWEEVYDEFKQWFLQGENSAYPFAFTVSGGEDITTTSIAGQYYFLRNDLGWRVRTTDEDQDVFWAGNGIPTDLTQRIVEGRAGRTIAHFGLQPLVTGIVGLEDLTAQAIMDFIVVLGYTFEDVIRILAAHAAGKINQPVEGGPYQIRDLNDLKDVIEGDDTATGGRDITAVDGT